MNKIIELPDPAIIEEEAGAWIIKLDSDAGLSHEQHLAFKAWMGRSLAHREAVKSMAQFWGKMNVLTELGMLQHVVGQKQAAGDSHSGFGFAGLAIRLAVTAFALFMVVGLFWVQFNGQGQSANGLYATAIGQQKTISLSDGSALQLNTNSQIRLDYSGDYRDIHLLQGEAHFIVAKDKDRPFRVSAGHGLVQAIGTAFSVYLNHDDVEVVITEGSVSLQSRQGFINKGAPASDPKALTLIPDRVLGQLSAGQSAVIKDVLSDSGGVHSVKAVVADVSPQELERRLSWRKGFIVFKGLPLNQVVDEVGRYSQMSIELTDPAMASIKIGGQFRVGEVDAILESLEINFGLAVKRVSYNHVQLSFALKEKTNE